MAPPASSPDSKQNRAARWVLPDLALAVSLITLLYCLLIYDGGRKLFRDSDTGWHIRTGEWILNHGQVPVTDLFSFTRPNAPWYAWEWLSDVLMALAYRAGGMAAVVFGSLLLLCLVSLLLFDFLRKRSGNTTLAWLMTLLVAAGSSLHWLARPHLFTMLFLLLFYRAFHSWSHSRHWLLLPFMALWTNLHGGFFLGVALAAIERHRPAWWRPPA